jgi:hypothetical protein
LKRKLEENSEADSTVTTYLTVNQGYQHFDEATICEGENFQFGIQNLSSSGEYIEIFNTINGCDSTVILTLNVIPKYVTNVRADICEGDYYTFGNQNLSTSGEYTEVFKAITGCDSMIVLTLNVIPKYRINKRIDICEGDIYIFGTQNLSTSGEYTEVFQSINGCDSIVTISLNVNSGYNITEDITITYVDNYMGWTEEGTYQRELLSLTGCDSTVITNLKVLQSLTQNIKLETGWNILSSYLIPTNATIDSVMETLRLEGKLVKVQDEANNSYEENELLNGWINNIGDYTITEGYRIRVNTNCDFDIIGKKIELPLDISLKKGINLISFPANASINAMQVIEPLINSGILLKVQDERGNAIENWGNFGWINSIGDFHAGEGYIVNVNEMGILTINDISEKSTQLTDAISKPEHFGVNYIGNGFNHMNINVVGLNESQLKAGDEIAVFDRNNCVGAIKLNENHLNSNRVSINASASEANFNNGFLEGNSIDFRIWSLETNQELKVMPEIIEGNTIFERQASVFIKLKKESNSTKNIEIFPNPASNILYIRFSSLPENGAKIVLMDVTGKQIFNTEVHSTIEKINTENLSPGIYLIKTSIQNQNRTHKIIII